MKGSFYAVLFASALFCQSAAAVKPSWQELSQDYTFDEYVKAFQKSYSEEELFERREIFDANLADILEHNGRSADGFKRGLSIFTDQTEEEKRAVLGYNKAAGGAGKGARRPLLRAGPSEALPAAVDWRACGREDEQHLCPLETPPATPLVTAVKNQGACGSCWAFASVGALETHYAIATGYLKTLSPQHLVSCAPNTEQCGGTGGCQGSTGDIAYEYISSIGGLATEFTYGYTSYFGVDGECDAKRAGYHLTATVSGYMKPKSNDYTSLMSAVAKAGPIVVNVDASKWHDYEEGIFGGCDYEENIDINHAVVLMGYGEDENGAYWLIRNSWGPEWGEQGYIRLAREKDVTCGMDSTPLDGVGCATKQQEATKVCGQCGVAFDFVYPIINK